MALTSIVIVTHNQLAFTRQCVESIRERTAEPFEFVVVDNGSTDATVEYLKTLGEAAAAGQWSVDGDKGSGVNGQWSVASAEVSAPIPARRNDSPLSRITILANHENRGFPAAANQGIRAATGQQILLLNNDTIVTTGWLARMLRALDGDPAIGLVGPCSNFVSVSGHSKPARGRK